MNSDFYSDELEFLTNNVLNSLKQKVLEFKEEIEENGYIELDNHLHHFSQWNGGEDKIYAVDLREAYIDDGSEGFTLGFEDLQVGNLIGILENLEAR